MTPLPLRLAVFGATSSIAQELIRLYAARSAAIALIARNAEHLGTVAVDARIRGATSVATWVADLDAAAGFDALIGEVVHTLGGFDVVVLAQGVLPDQDACERSPASAADAIHTNLAAPAALVLGLASTMLAHGGGTIAVLGSVAGDRGRRSNYVYGAAKGGLALFLDGLRHRLRGSGVYVVTVKPGTVRSRMTDGMEGLPLPSEAGSVASMIVRAIEQRRAVAYVPWFWRPIMFAIRSLPRGVFERTRL